MMNRRSFLTKGLLGLASLPLVSKLIPRALAEGASAPNPMKVPAGLNLIKDSLTKTKQYRYFDDVKKASDDIMYKARSKAHDEKYNESLMCQNCSHFNPEEKDRAKKVVGYRPCKLIKDKDQKMLGASSSGWCMIYALNPKAVTKKTLSV